MMSFRRRVPCAVALALADASAMAAVRELPRHPPMRRIVVHPRPVRPAAAPLGVAVAPGIVFRTPFTVVAGGPGRAVRVPHYIEPDGTDDEYADTVTSIDGTPCGEACTRRSLESWNYMPID